MPLTTLAWVCRASDRKAPTGGLGKAKLERLVEEATVDAYGTKVAHRRSLARVSNLPCNRPFDHSGTLSSKTIEKWLSAATQSLIGRLHRAEILSIASCKTSFFERIAHPALAEIEIDWQGMEIEEIYPVW